MFFSISVPNMKVYFFVSFKHNFWKHSRRFNGATFLQQLCHKKLPIYLPKMQYPQFFWKKDVNSSKLMMHGKYDIIFSYTIS